MKAKNQYYKQIIKILTELNKSYPSYNMGRHISTALSDYPDVWDLSDKELHFALTKYQAELNLNDQPEENIDKIIKDGLDLNHILDDEDEDY